MVADDTRTIAQLRRLPPDWGALALLDHRTECRCPLQQFAAC
ncbi:hypothetical protein [Nocardia sp. NPDC051981]